MMYVLVDGFTLIVYYLFLIFIYKAYPMYKNPRGLCLIINVYNINGAVRRWSDLDVKLLSDLFRQLCFQVTVFSDLNGDDLGAEVRFFAQCERFLFQDNMFKYFYFSSEFYENPQSFLSVKRTCRSTVLRYLFDESWRRGFFDRARWKKGLYIK